MVVAHRFLYSNGFRISSESPWRSCAPAWMAVTRNKKKRENHTHFFTFLVQQDFLIRGTYWRCSMLHDFIQSEQQFIWVSDFCFVLFLSLFFFFFYLKLRRWGQGRGGGEEYRPLPSFPSHTFPRRDGGGMWLSLLQNFCFFLLCIRQERPTE